MVVKLSKKQRRICELLRDGNTFREVSILLNHEKINPCSVPHVQKTVQDLKDRFRSRNTMHLLAQLMSLGYIALAEVRAEEIKHPIRATDPDGYIPEGHRATHVKRLGKTSRYTGVCRPAGSRKYMANISIQGKRKHLGMFEDEEEAAQAYRDAVKALESGASEETLDLW